MVALCGTLALMISRNLFEQQNPFSSNSLNLHYFRPFLGHCRPAYVHTSALILISYLINKEPQMVNRLPLLETNPLTRLLY